MLNQISGANGLFPLFNQSETENTSSDKTQPEDFSTGLFDNNKNLSYDSYHAELYSFPTDNEDITGGKNIHHSYPEVEKYSSSNKKLKPDSKMQKEFPVDKNGSMPGEVQTKLAAKYNSLEEFDKDMKAGKFSYLDSAELDSVRRQVRDKEDMKEFPSKIDNPNSLDSFSSWNNDTIQKLVEQYDNIEQLDKDLKNGRFSYISPDSINALIAKLLHKSA